MTERIWEFDVMDEWELEDLTDSTLKEAEDLLGVKLPFSFIELMQSQNGGRLFRNSFELDSEKIEIDHLLGIGRKSNEGILVTPYMIKEWELPSNIVLISGDGHSWVVLDYRHEESEPCVSFIDAELGTDIRLANNFEGFIDQLTRDSETNEFELVAENSYTPAQLEKEVKKGEDPFSITDSFLYFSVADCDLDWLISQTIIVMDNPDEFIAPEVLAYTMRKIADTEIKAGNQRALIALAKKIQHHDSVGVRKYYKKIQSHIQI